MKKVLLVDDDTICNFLSAKMLERIGYGDNVHTALNGRQAIDKYLRGAEPLPDVILLDLNMPVMDGFTFLETFREMNLPNKEQIKIIVVSSSGSPQDIDRARRLGVRQFLTKPVEANRLREALDIEFSIKIDKDDNTLC